MRQTKNKMKAKKEIKKSGNSAVIVLTAENLKLYKFKIGDIVNIEITKEKKE